MKSILTKKIVIIFSVLITIVLAAVIVAYATGNTRYPLLSDPDGVFYERLDDQGNIVYTITNRELFEEIKKNDGLQQLLFMVDETLLQDYLDNLTEEQIQNRIKKMTYGTSDDDEILALDDQTKTERESNFQLNMTLSGYEGREEDYASLLLAREAYVRFALVDNGDITDLQIAKEFINNAWEDIDALRIRFMSSGDATYVLQMFNLLTFETKSLRAYNGFIYKLETLLDNKTVPDIVEAYETVTPYYFNDAHYILNLNDAVVYTLGTEGVYTDGDDNEYTLDESGNLLNSDQEVEVSFTLIFESKTLATTYKNDHTTYYTVSKTDPFDADEDTIVRDSEENIAFTIDKDGLIFDSMSVNVTATTKLFVNKVYTPIEKVTRITKNISAELSAEEVLAKYILMYNYVYGLYRDTLPETATAEDLIALNDENLKFNFDTVQAAQPSLASYMFKTMTLASPYTPSAKSYPGSNDTSYYLIYKLSEGVKLNANDLMLDNIVSQISIPVTIGSSITLPTAGWYGSTIAWTPSSSTYISNKGVYTAPPTDTLVTMKYRITFNGKTRDGEIIVTILADGDTVEVEASTDEVISFESILNDAAVYESLRDTLVEDAMIASNSSATISTNLAKMRAEYGFKIYDFYLGLEYSQTDRTYTAKTKGDKTVIASFTGRPGNEDQPIEITADQFFEYTLAKNASLYTMYASQYKEILSSTYFEAIYGTETNLLKNKSDKMADLVTYVEQVKDYYPYLQNIYAQYGLAFPYSSFQDYIYLEHNGAKNETDLLKTAVLSSLQPYLISETIDNYSLLELLYPTIEDYFNNYFSLNVTHLLLYFDFDENGTADDYLEYVEGLDETEVDEMDTLNAGFETAILDYLADTDHTFTSLVTAYRAASRENETWGVYKQNGFNLLTQNLNTTDDNDVTHSLQYSGTYGVSETYVPEFVDALILLYQEYKLPQNAALAKLYSELVASVNGVHMILVTKGDNFTQPNTKFTEANPASPVYSAGLESSQEMPTIEQFVIYANYYFLSQLYDLTDTTVPAKYGITIPKIPASMKTALTFYAGDLVSGLYVLGTINIDEADRLTDGRFIASAYTDKTNAELLALLTDTKDAYYQALFSAYTQD